MTPQLARYYFGRLNLIIAGRDKRRTIRDALSSHAVVGLRAQRWGFYEFAEIESYFTGFLVKYRPTAEEEVANPDRGVLEDLAIQNRVTAKSRFFLHVHSGLLAYHPVAYEIPRDTFANRFVEVFEHALQNFFVNAEIQSIEEERKLLDELNEFKSIRKVSIYLHPSNPSSRKVWRSTDERLRNLNATSYRENYETKPQKGSLKIANDRDLRKKIAMAEDGYGKVAVTGERKGKIETVSTSDNPLSILAPSNDEDPRIPFPVLRDAIDGFLARFKL